MRKIAELNGLFERKPKVSEKFPPLSELN